MIRKIRSSLSQIKKLASLRPKVFNFLVNCFLIALQKEPNKLILKRGFKLHAPENLPLIEMTSEIFHENTYTSNKLSGLTKKVVIDIGANIGIFSLLAAKEAKNLVYAFEPFPQNISYLKKNLKLNNINNVVVQEVAVSDRVGLKNLHLAHNPAGNILLDLYENREQKNTIKVSTTTLEAIIDNNSLTKVDFLKMDCEGSEGKILLSTSIEYLQKIKYIAMEFHDNVSVLNHSQIQELLDKIGFVTKLRWNGQGPFGFIYAYR